MRRPRTPMLVFGVVVLGAVVALAGAVVGLPMLERGAAQAHDYEYLEEAIALRVLDEEVVDQLRTDGSAVAFVELDTERLVNRLEAAELDTEQMLAALEELRALVAAAREQLPKELGDEVA